MAGVVHGRGVCGRGTCMAGGRVWRGCACCVYYEIQSVNARTVRILLECILVLYNFFLTEIRVSETPEELHFKTLNEENSNYSVT